ncbi:hypothetical protein [Roseivirga echinicomitans]|uniref:Phenylalanyl-tRNA synthetase subunit beta n=1 Tax=Roseivirga echinicomitans TaxID=296218 RepID=A0A150XDJ7_9BACT|nr:hypothetical protein [Roseivirga echinicomitans]KYG76754.1 hypothetical protein AWN68_06935 [Roseivirga echinicomitans]
MAELSLFQRLDRVQQQLKQLVVKHETLKQENKALANQNTELKGQIIDLRTQVADFKNQDKITKIVSNTTVEKEESTELKHKLNEYIKEIDKCITHLSE